MKLLNDAMIEFQNEAVIKRAKRYANSYANSRLAAFVGLGLLLFLFVFTSFYLI